MPKLSLWVLVHDDERENFQACEGRVWTYEYVCERLGRVDIEGPGPVSCMQRHSLPGYFADAFFADTFLVSTFFAGAFFAGVGVIARSVRSMPMILISSTRGCAPVTDAQ